MGVMLEDGSRSRVRLCCEALKVRTYMTSPRDLQHCWMKRRVKARGMLSIAEAPKGAKADPRDRKGRGERQRERSGQEQSDTAATTAATLL